MARSQYELLSAAPYGLTSDDVIFTVWAERNGVGDIDRSAARQQFFSKGQPCLRSSPLAKTHGFGIHSDSSGRVALVASGSQRYAELLDDESVVKRPAMRSRRRA